VSAVVLRTLREESSNGTRDQQPNGNTAVLNSPVNRTGLGNLEVQLKPEVGSCGCANQGDPSAHVLGAGC
jgi:hypothetical protein